MTLIKKKCLYAKTKEGNDDEQIAKEKENQYRLNIELLEKELSQRCKEIEQFDTELIGILNRLH